MTESRTEKSNSGPPFLEFGFRPPLSEISGSVPGRPRWTTCILCLISSTSLSVPCSTSKISERLWRNRWRQQLNGPPSTTPMTDPITWSHKTVCPFCCFLHDTFAKCLARFRTRWSEPWSSEDISSSKAEDSQEWNYQGQDGCFASSCVCHYHSPQTQALVDFAKDISEFPLQMTKMRFRSLHQRRISN